MTHREEAEEKLKPICNMEADAYDSCGTAPELYAESYASMQAGEQTLALRRLVMVGTLIAFQLGSLIDTLEKLVEGEDGEDGGKLKEGFYD